MWLIVETSDADTWKPRYGSRLIPQPRRPSVAQPSRRVAEQEALRLAGRHPGKRFVVFEAVCAGITTTIATHITLGGEVVASRSTATLVDIGTPEDDIPF